MPPGESKDVYDRIERELDALLEPGIDAVAAMATAASVLYQGVDKASWVGFYRVVAPDLLRIGPYQGPVGCMEIAFAQGVCGAAAARQETVIVPDVHAFPGHIACDAAARSEIVVPVLAGNGQLVAVLDVDSHQPAAFNEVDRQHLERIVRLLTPYV